MEHTVLGEDQGKDIGIWTVIVVRCCIKMSNKTVKQNKLKYFFNRVASHKATAPAIGIYTTRNQIIAWFAFTFSNGYSQ